ncbi:MAG: DUF6082 family protein [Streptosporangiaceae bacterium]
MGIIFSPVALQHLAAHHFNWVQLSNVGRSYGAASAILSALAIIGVSFTLIVQARQSKENRNHYTREMRTDLLRIGMADERLLEAWGNIRVPTGIDRDLAVYENLRKQLAKAIEAEYQRSVAIGPPARPLPALRTAQSPRRPHRVPFPDSPTSAGFASQ